MSLRFSEDDFKESQQSTLGAQFVTHKIETNDCIMQFDIWDTAGQERFKALGALYYKNAKAAVVIYDITLYQTLNRAKECINEVKENADTDIFITLVGNKLDQESQRQVPQQDALDYAKQNNLMYFECSAKTGQNVKELFLQTMRNIPDGDDVGTQNLERLCVKNKSEEGGEGRGCGSC